MALAGLRQTVAAAQGLIRGHFPDLVVDGVWGPSTQSSYNLSPSDTQQSVVKLVESNGYKLIELINSTLDPKQRVFREQVVPVLLSRAAAMGFANPKLAAAQLAHESTLGRSESGTFNYGGVKAAPGEPGTVRGTTEYVHGTPVKTSAKFKDYASPGAFIDDYLNALIRKWPGTVTASTPQQWVNALVANPKMKYFTAPVSLYTRALQKLEHYFVA